MWYEKLSAIIGFNVGVLIALGLVLFYSFTAQWTWQPYAVMLLLIIQNLYNSLVSYNRAIDKTVESLAKHYEKQMMEEIQKAVNKAMGM